MSVIDASKKVMLINISTLTVLVLENISIFYFI